MFLTCVSSSATLASFLAPPAVAAVLCDAGTTADGLAAGRPVINEQ